MATALAKPGAGKFKLLNLDPRHAFPDLLSVAYIFKTAAFDDLKETKFDSICKVFIVLRAIYLLRRREILLPVLTLANFLKFRLVSTQRPHTFWQHFRSVLFFGRFGLTANLPPNATGLMVAHAHKNGPWKRHVTELQVSQKKGPIFGVYTIGRFMIEVSDPDLVEEVMLDKKGYPTRGDSGFSDLTKLGLLGLPTGDMHSKHRRIIGAFMSNTWLKSYSLAIQRETNLLLDKWTKASEINETCNVNYDLSMVTLEVIMQACTGNSGFCQDVKSAQLLSRDDNELARGLDFALKEIVIRTAMPWLAWFPSPSKAWLEQKMRDMWGVARSRADVIAQHPDAPLMIYTALKEAKDENGQPALTEQEIYDELQTIRGAGHETTSNTLSWAIYLLWKNPDKLRVLQEEVDAVVKGDDVTYEESKELKYTRNVMYETLRLYPTVPSFPREAAENLKLGGYDIPKGSMVFVSQNPMNRNPTIWKDPLEFQPERFAETGELQMSKPVGVPGCNGPAFGFVPFGAGSRTCIGQRLAVLEAVQILGAIVKKFTWELDREKMATVSSTEPDGIVEVADITLGPKEGLYMKFSPRKIPQH